MTESIGFIGLGNMGAPMVANLLQGHWGVRVFDQDRRRMVAAAEQGAVPVGCVSEVSAPIVILMLPSGDIVAEVLVGKDGLVKALPPGAIVVDMSSVDPVVYFDLEGELKKRGIDLVDAPVSGNVSGAESATLTIMAGGSSATVERVRPVLEAMGSAIFHTGKLGTGQTTKALNNLMSAGGLILAVEAMLLGRRAGLDPSQFVDIVNLSTGRNNSTERKIKRFVLNGAYNSGFNLSLMAKDLRTASSIATRLGVALPLASAAVAIAEAADKALGATADHTEIARWIEEETGLAIV